MAHSRDGVEQDTIARITHTIPHRLNLLAELLTSEEGSLMSWGQGPGLLGNICRRLDILTTGGKRVFRMSLEC